MNTLCIPVRQPYRVTSDARQHITGDGRGAASSLCGIDFIDRIGKPDLLSVTDGEVVYVHAYNPKYKWGGDPGAWNTLGLFVVIKSIIEGITVWLRYCHLERADVKTGDIVTAGQSIGIYGDTGASHGAHVHMDAWVAWGDKDKAAGLGLVAESGLRVVPPYPGIPISLHNVNPTKFFSAQKLDVINTGGK